MATLRKWQEAIFQDQLVTLSNHEAHLTYPDGNNYLYSINRKKNKLIRVYNVEAEKKHVYFISKFNILVHNPCNMKMDGRSRRRKKINNLIQCRDVSSSLEEMEGSNTGASSHPAGFTRVTSSYNHEDFPPIAGEPHQVEEVGSTDDTPIGKQKSHRPMSMTDYEEKNPENISDYDKPSQVMEVSSTKKDEMLPEMIEGEGKPKAGIQSFTRENVSMTSLREVLRLKRETEDKRQLQQSIRANAIYWLYKKQAAQL